MKRKLAAATAGLLAAGLLLSACSSVPVLEVEDVPGAQSGQQSGAQSGAESGDLALDDEQVARIVAGVQGVLDQADTEKSVGPLASRLIDPALSMRTGQLVRAEKTGTAQAPLIIGNDLHSATVGSAFPRVLITASEASGDTPSEVFVFTQADAKSDYMLENWTRLIGGTPVRGLSVKTGSRVLPGDYAGLRLTPAETVQTYVTFLNSPDNAEYAVFQDATFQPRYAEELTALSEAAAVAGTVTAQASTSSAPTTSVLLDTGSALVASSITYTNVYTLTVEGAKLQLGGPPAKYVDDPAVTDPVTVTYQVNLFFVVPPKDSEEPIAVVGAERVIQSVTR